jgi:hypothetical protein
MAARAAEPIPRISSEEVLRLEELNASKHDGSTASFT